MIRTIIMAAALLLTHEAALAQDNSNSATGSGLEPHQWVFTTQQLQGVDMNANPHEYKVLTRRNQKVLKNTLVSYTNNTLKSIGMSELGISLVGNVVGLATQGARLNLNESRTFALELRDVNDSERTLYLGVTLDW